MKFETLIVIFTFLISVGCYSGAKLKNKMAYLDGDNHRLSTIVAGIPVTSKIVQKRSLMEGDVFSVGLTGLPIRDVHVILRDKNQRILKEIKTDQKGRFKFEETLADGDYLLEFRYKEKIQKRMVPLKGYRAKVLRVYFD